LRGSSLILGVAVHLGDIMSSGGPRLASAGSPAEARSVLVPPRGSGLDARAAVQPPPGQPVHPISILRFASTRLRQGPSLHGCCGSRQSRDCSPPSTATPSGYPKACGRADDGKVEGKSTGSDLRLFPHSGSSSRGSGRPVVATVETASGLAQRRGGQLPGLGRMVVEWGRTARESAVICHAPTLHNERRWDFCVSEPNFSYRRERPGCSSCG
jgi:hypothetical protein